MIDNIQKEDLIITTSHIKKTLLKEISKTKKILDVKIITLEEFKNKYFGTYNEKALYFLMKEYNLKYDIAKEYLKNIFFNIPLIKPYYEKLKQKKLLIENKQFKKNIKHITLIGIENIDPYILKEIKKYDHNIIKEKTNNYKPKVLEFETQTEELVYVATSILKDLKTMDINNICVVNIDSEYENELNRIFKLFKIPVSRKQENKIYSTKTAKIFLDNLIKTKDVKKSLENLPQNDIYNQIISVLNKYIFINEIDQTFIDIIKAELKHTNKKTDTIVDAVKIINIDQITNPNKKYYMIGFNQGLIPHIYQDNDLLSDKIKKELGIITSEEKNKQEKIKITNKIKTLPNLVITYKLKDTFNTYYPSPIIKYLNLEVIKQKNNNLIYSNDYNKLLLASLLDNYINYNEKDEDLNILYANYPSFEYSTYDNQYQNIDKNELANYLKNHLTLSYSSMNNYYLCPFRFYIQNILKLDPFTETFPTLIGNLFHYCLSHMYEENFDLEKYYSQFLNDKTLNPKEKFFLKKLYNQLKEDIEIIKWQDKHTEFNKKSTEKTIFINKKKNLSVKFMGIVDKINTMQKDGQTYSVIIDYKTGNIQTNLDNLNYGLNMQLPTYVYLIKKGLNDKCKIAGFYLQKILHNQKLEDNNNINENLKLNGYTINNQTIIEDIDDTYQNSEIIKGMKQTKNGFYAYTKLINENEIDKLINIVDKKIDDVIEKIENAEFNVNPKRIENKLISCEYCKFKDLCFKKEENITNLPTEKFQDIIGGDNNA